MKTDRISISALLELGVFGAFALLLFLMSATKLVSFQLDKAVMLLIVALGMLKHLLVGDALPLRVWAALLAVLMLALASYLVNLPESSLIVFFPALGLVFVAFLAGEQKLLGCLYWALILHIWLGIFYVFSSYLFGINSHVHPMYDKGLPFLHAAKGLTTTVQAFGTLLIAWFLIYYWKKDRGETGPVDTFLFYTALLGLFLTFNRNSYLVFYLVIFFKHKRVFWLSIVGAVLFYLYFFELINKLIFNVSTLSSRADLLQAFRIAFFEQTNWMEYLLGHGNNMVHDSIAQETVYQTGYIENGTSVLLYTYGFAGYLFYLVAVVAFATVFFLRGMTFYAATLFYIFVIAQQFTHEFFSTTIYLLLLAFSGILYRSRQNETKNTLLSPTQ